MSYKSYALIIIITGEKTIAKRLRICGELIRNKGNTCDDNSCKAECVKRHKQGRGACELGFGGRPKVCHCHPPVCPPIPPPAPR